MTILFAFVGLCLCGTTLAQVTARAGCPQVTPRKNFEPKKYLGRWYEAQRYFTNYELGGRCNTVDYSPGGNSTTFNRAETFISTFNGKVQKYQKTLRQTDPKRNPGKAVINFPLTPDGALYNKWVVGTDYDSWAVVYGCTQFGTLRVEYSWILTRERNPKESVIKKAYTLINAKKINARNYYKVDQKDCDDVDGEDAVSENLEDSEVETIRFVS